MNATSRRSDASSRKAALNSQEVGDEIQRMPFAQCRLRAQFDRRRASRERLLPPSSPSFFNAALRDMYYTKTDRSPLLKASMTIIASAEASPFNRRKAVSIVPLNLVRYRLQEGSRLSTKNQIESERPEIPQCKYKEQKNQLSQDYPSGSKIRNM